MAFHSHLQLEGPGHSRAGGVGLAEQPVGPVGPTHRRRLPSEPSSRWHKTAPRLAHARGLVGCRTSSLKVCLPLNTSRDLQGPAQGPHSPTPRGMGAGGLRLRTGPDFSWRNASEQGNQRAGVQQTCTERLLCARPWEHDRESQGSERGLAIDTRQG